MCARALLKVKGVTTSNCVNDTGTIVIATVFPSVYLLDLIKFYSN